MPQSVTGNSLKGFENKFKEQKATKQNAQPDTAHGTTNQITAKVQNKTDKTLDLSLPSEIDKGLIVQRSIRTSKAIQQQIRDIAKNLDYDMLSSSKSIANGAPVISYGSYSPKCLGRVTHMVANDHTKYSMQ